MFISSRSRVVLAIVVLAGGWLSLSAVSADESTPAPPLILAADQGPVNLESYKGRVVYLDFWASWCAPCRKSFPWMKEMEARYGKDGFAVVAVNLDKDKALAAKFLSAYAPGFTIAYDPQGSAAETYKVQAMPSSYLIDRAGRLRARHVGFRDQDKTQLEDQIRTLLRSGTGS